MKVFTYQLNYPHFSLKRKGVVIEWEKGCWGEASPLEGWSRDNLEDVLMGLKVNPINFSPALGFAKEARSFSSLSVPICSLLAGNSQQILHEAESLVNQGVRHAKLKVKNIPLKEAILLINQLTKSFVLRLDFNRCLNLDDALLLAENIDLSKIDFFEEPLKNPKELLDFPYPIALDECLREKEHLGLCSLEQVKALVLKPTMLGGIEKCKEWACWKKSIVLSSSFESGIGIFQIMQLASEFTDLLAPLGLDTYRYLEEDLLEEPLRYEAGFMHTPNRFAIKQHLLESV